MVMFLVHNIIPLKPVPVTSGTLESIVGQGPKVGKGEGLALGLVWEPVVAAPNSGSTQTLGLHQTPWQKRHPLG